MVPTVEGGRKNCQEKRSMVMSTHGEAAMHMVQRPALEEKVLVEKEKKREKKREDIPVYSGENASLAWPEKLTNNYMQNPNHKSISIAA
jgi:hypothetical protein